MAKKTDYNKEWAKIVAKAWSDERFKERLLRNPAQTIKEMGIEIPAGIRLEIHPQSSKVFHLTLPEKPSEELSESELRQYAAGAAGVCPLGLGQQDDPAKLGRATI